ncbi:MAG: toll/interleukin-1 receptor domain-containing protein [bacterium]|nr:toll/interleukin-1 receptor domain-containing protein [bacterium]
MTREEALKLLRGGPEGISEWNRRRKADEDVPDMSGSRLRNLRLCKADLSGMDLGKGSISGADLSWANLHGSNLHRTNIRYADLTGTDLSHAFLNHAVVYRSILNKTDMSHASFGGTILATDLSRAVGLEKTFHQYPSTIDINECILNFKDDLPEKFLRGCGLREEEIAHFRSQIGKPVRFYSCFISYSTRDEDFATRLYNDFQGAGIRCWKWDKDAKTGKSLWGEIDHAVRDFNKLVLVASESSLKSPYVHDEIERAIQKERQLQQRKSNGELIAETDVLFPVRLDDYIFEKWEHERKVDVNKKVIADARGWDTDTAKYNKVRDKLIKDLKRA